ncbi:MAG: HAMP domain-containing histidine kinase, partial [Bdellovibrio sp.]|nr:HAMP domain-containing histidine kinase [Bdellovibrio sp.]
MKNNLVLKLSLVLALLLSVVLYKMNDFYRQEKMFQAESQVKKQITAIKTSVAAQITTIKNVVSSYSVDIKENQINWVQLDPFFALARVQKRTDGSFAVLQIVGRSGTMAEKWNAGYLDKALSVHKNVSEKSIQTRLFKDRSGGKYVALIFNNNEPQQVAVVGSADYFQKFFDLDRDGRMISLLVTNDHVLVAHTESDYIASLSDEDSLSSKKYAIEKEEIAGTNLMAVSYTLRRAVAAAWVVPWSVVGLVAGFGFVLIGLLFYGLDPLERKVERYKKQEREQIFKDTLQSENAAVQENLVANGVIQKSDLPTKPAPTKSSEFELIQKTREDSVDRAHQAFAEPTESLSDNSLMGPLKQALANLDVVFKQEKIIIETDISSSLTYPIYYGAFIKTFENLLRNAVEAMTDTYDKKITIRAYDIDGLHTVIEIQDNGIGLSIGSSQGEKIWQPFYTTKSKSEHMGLGLTESLSSVRRAGGDLTIESLPISGVLVKMIMKKEKAMTATELAQTERTQIAFTEPLVHFNEDSISAADLNPELTAAGSGAAGTDMNEDTITKLIEHKTAEEEFMDIDLDDVLSLD